MSIMSIMSRPIMIILMIIMMMMICYYRGV